MRCVLLFLLCALFAASPADALMVHSARDGLLRLSADETPYGDEVWWSLVHFITKEYGARRDVACEIVERALELPVERGTLLLAVMAVESRYNPRDVSSAGAVGLGQIMPIHLTHEEQERQVRIYGRGLSVACKIPGREGLYDVSGNFCATGFILGGYIAKYGDLKRALAAYVGAPDASAGFRYAERVLAVHRKFLWLAGVADNRSASRGK